MNGWENFFIAEVGASAALTGLIFVGVSLNLTRILSIAGLPNRALTALILLLTILITASLMLVPAQPLWLIGVELLLIGLTSWIGLFRLDFSTYKAKEAKYRRSYLVNFAMDQFALLPYSLAGLFVLLNGTNGLYWLVPAVIFSFLKAILDAWVLLVEINR